MDYRHKIIEEAAIMFRTYGIRAVTMDMLAGNLGISKRTIYEVFTDKDELLRGVLKWMYERQSELTKMILNESDNVIEAIFKLIDIMSGHLSSMSPAFQMDIKKHYRKTIENMKENYELPYYENNSEILKRGIKEGVFREDIDIGITNKCLLEVAKISNDKNIFPPDDFMNKDVVRNFYINYLRGISTQKGLDLINFYERK